jgi:hypothetical protein
VTLISFWVGLFWAAAIHPLGAPDEPAYLQAVMQTQQERRLPEIHFDFTTNPLGEVVGTPGNPAARAYIESVGMNDRLRLLAYENVQPPLYFLITGLITQFVPPIPTTVLYLTRLLGVAFGAGTVYFCWAATRQLAPGAPGWAVGTAGVVALLPEFCFNNARMGNDSLVNCLSAAAFYVWFRGLRDRAYDPHLLWAGSVVGLAILAKLNAVLLVPGLLLLVLFRARQGHRRGEPRAAWVGRALPLAAGALGSLVLVTGWWVVRNMIVYGEPSGTGAVNVFWTLNEPGLNWDDLTARTNFVLSSWMSFWGLFGWMDILMPFLFYSQALVLTALSLALSGLAGVRLMLRRWRRRERGRAYVWQAGVLLAVTAFLLVGSFVQFSLTVALQPQGRYLYMALLPAALLLTGGLYALTPGRWLKGPALSIPLLWLAAWNAVGLILVR